MELETSLKWVGKSSSSSAHRELIFFLLFLRKDSAFYELVTSGEMVDAWRYLSVVVEAACAAALDSDFCGLLTSGEVVDAWRHLSILLEAACAGDLYFDFCELLTTGEVMDAWR